MHPWFSHRRLIGFGFESLGIGMLLVKKKKLKNKKGVQYCRENLLFGLKPDDKILKGFFFKGTLCQKLALLETYSEPDWNYFQGLLLS